MQNKLPSETQDKRCHKLFLSFQKLMLGNNIIEIEMALRFSYLILYEKMAEHTKKTDLETVRNHQELIKNCMLEVLSEKGWK